MGSTLEHGIYLPSEGEKNCYQGLAGNWNKVDGALGDVAELKQSIESKFTKEIVTELPTEDINPFCIYMILKTDPETDNIYDEWVYINNNWEYLGNTKVDMTQYYTKQEVNQLPAVASGVTATKVGNYDAHIANGDIHVTASDKSKWNTVALIKQLRLVNAQVGSATTIAFSDFDDTNGIKVGDKCMDLDGKMFEITAVDTTNQTVTVGSALVDLALDANVVHTNEINSSGIGIIEGVKEVGGVDFNTLTTQGLYGANASGSTNNPVASPCVVQVIRRINSVIQIANVSSSSAYKSRYIRYCADITAQPPVWQSWVKFATDDEVVHKSGDETISGNKTFSSINGVEPSSLSLPDLNNGIDISGYITTPNAVSTYAPVVNGWISIVLKTQSTSGAVSCFATQGDFANGHYSATGLPIPNATNPCVMLCLPVIGGIAVNIYTKGSNNTYIDSAKFFPCLGNV